MDIDHPAVGAGHIFLQGSADSLAAASLLVRRAPWSAWVTVAREHRLPVLLERPLTESAREVWCMGYTGTGNPLVPAAIEAQVTHRPFTWLQTTTGRLAVAASEVPGVEFLSLPGGSLVHLVLRLYRWPGDPEDRTFDRLGHLLGRSPGVVPTPPELRELNRLHAASVAVRSHEKRGPELIRTLSDHPPESWSELALLRSLADAGEVLIRAGRGALRRHAESSPDASAWLVPAGAIPRGTHGKALATQGHRLGRPVGLVEQVDHGYTKAWVVLPEGRPESWIEVAELFARHATDFSYTGRRGAGALPAEAAEPFTEQLQVLLSSLEPHR